jgi:hypothetical protein
MQDVCIILSSIAYLALQYFPTLSNKRDEFRNKKVNKYKVNFDFLYNVVLKYL